MSYGSCRIPCILQDTRSLFFGYQARLMFMQDSASLAILVLSPSKIIRNSNLHSTGIKNRTKRKFWPQSSFIAIKLKKVNKNTIYNNHFDFIQLKYEITYVYSKNKLFLDSHRSVTQVRIPLRPGPRRPRYQDLTYV